MFRIQNYTKTEKYKYRIAVTAGKPFLMAKTLLRGI